MQQGAARFGEIIEDREAVASALGLETGDLANDLPVQVVSTGLPFLYIPLASDESVDRARLAHTGLPASSDGPRGAFIFHSVAGSNRAYSRMIATIGGTIWEDPATGSASGPLGAYLVRYGLAPGEGVVEIMSEQGTQMGRQSFIHLRVRNEGGVPGDVEVGGGVVPVLEGRLELS
jgi:trans-2,3-dihydro-3-hydroxyanthranilate isomerase